MLLFCIHPSSTLVDNRTTTSPSKSVTIKTMNYNQNHSIDLGGVEVEFSQQASDDLFHCWWFELYTLLSVNGAESGNNTLYIQGNLQRCLSFNEGLLRPDFSHTDLLSCLTGVWWGTAHEVNRLIVLLSTTTEVLQKYYYKTTQQQCSIILL